MLKFASAILAAAGGACLVLWVAALNAQSIGPVAGQGPGAIGAPFTASNGHLSVGTTTLGPPALSAGCGTGASIAGSDSAYILNSGTSTAATCTVTPAVAWNKRPVCSIDSQGGATPAFTVAGNGAINITGVADSSVYNVICLGQPGG